MSNDATLAPARKGGRAKTPTPSKTVPATPIENEASTNGNLVTCRVCAARATEYLECTLDLDPPNEDLRSGNTIRLARFAIRDLEMIESDDKWTDSELSETLFDVLAMVEAAIHSPHDSIAQERLQLLTSAHTLIEAAALTVFDGDDEAAPKAIEADKIAAAVTRDTPLPEGGEFARNLMLRCSYDIEQLAGGIVRCAEDMSVENGDGAILRTLGMRVAKLNGMLMSYLGGDGVTIADAHSEIYGGYGATLPAGELQ